MSDTHSKQAVVPYGTENYWTYS